MLKVVEDVTAAEPIGDRIAFLIGVIDDLGRRQRETMPDDFAMQWTRGYKIGNAAGYEHCAEMLRRWLVHES